MQQRVMILVAFFVLLLAGCAQKQEAIVNSGNNQQATTEMPVEVKTLLDQYSIPDGVELPEIVAAPPNFNFSDINDSIYDVFLVTFVWGRILPFGPPVNAPTVWDGSLSVNGPSIVRAVAPIEFERGEDSLVTEDVPSAENWGSTTTRSFDGLIFLVLYDKVTPTLVPQVLTFNTPPITLQYDFSQLTRLVAYYQVDPFNGVAVAAHKIRLHNCREGFFKGVWQKSDSSDNRGMFRGLWFNQNEDTLGVMNGHFWRNENGVGMLAGNISGLHTDQVIAELQGIWDFDDYRMCPNCGTGHGQIRGRFRILNGEEHGFFRGEFGDYSLPPNDRNMPLHGRWHLDCIDLVTDEDPTSN